MIDPKKCLHESAQGPDDVGMIECGDCGGSWPLSYDEYVQLMSDVANGPVAEFPIPVPTLRKWLVDLRAGRVPENSDEPVRNAALAEGDPTERVVFLAREEVLELLEHFDRVRIEEAEAALTRVLSDRRIYEPVEEMVKVPKRLLEAYFNNDFTESDELELQAVLAEHNLAASKTNSSSD